MDPRHRDPHPVLPPGHVPRAAEPLGAVALHPLGAVAGEGAHLPGRQDEPGDPVADGVGDHDVVPDPVGDLRGQQAQAVGLAEAAEAAGDRAVAVEEDHLVVTRRRRRARSRPGPDEAGSGTALAGKRRSLGSTTGGTYGESPGCRVPRARCSRDQLLQQRGDGVGVALAGVLRDDVALRVDQHQGRPGPRGVGLPGRQLGVVEHRVVDGVALDGGDQRVRVGLVDELRRVDADDDQLLGVLLLHRAQLVEDVQAVDAAERPEVEQDEAASEVADGQRGGGVEPAAAGELGGTDMHPPILARRRDAGATRVRAHEHTSRGRQRRRRADRLRRPVVAGRQRLHRPAREGAGRAVVDPDRPAGLGRPRGRRAHRAPRVAAGRRPSTSTSRSATPRTPAG